jgi:hypothetical protein
MPITKKCPSCGKTFEPRDKRVKYCCESCSKEAHKKGVLHSVHKFRGKEISLKPSAIPITQNNKIKVNSYSAQFSYPEIRQLRENAINIHMDLKAKGDKFEPQMQNICIEILKLIEAIDGRKPITGKPKPVIPITKKKV